MHTRAPITLRSRTIAIALLVAMVALQMAGLRELLAAPSTAAQASANQSPAAQQSASQKPTAQSAASAIPAAQVPSGKNLIINGDLSKGAGDAPDHWRTEGWEQKGDVT